LTVSKLEQNTDLDLKVLRGFDTASRASKRSFLDRGHRSSVIINDRYRELNAGLFIPI
jgi:hypothetical protein